jgi:sensor histidine kinase YesM
MHPLFAHRKWVALYLIGWLLGGVLLALFFTMLRPRPLLHAMEFAIPLNLIFGFVALSAWWVCRSNPLSGPRPVRIFTTQMLAAIQVSAAWFVAASLWGVVMARAVSETVSRAEILQDAGSLFLLGLPLYLVSAVVHYLVIGFEASHAAERRILQSDVSAREAELRALRAQLDPHFLFNSLNSINALVGSDPEGARRMCERLGDFMRRTLALGAKDEVPLAEELALVDRYLEIEQVRFGERLQITREIDPATATCMVPPLLLQPLVENAVKHGVARRVEGGCIRIAAHRANGRVGIVVENPVDPDAPPKRGQGVGLENVRRRLEAYRGRETHLEAWLEGTRFRVEVTLPAGDLPLAPTPEKAS